MSDKYFNVYDRWKMFFFLCGVSLCGTASSAEVSFIGQSKEVLSYDAQKTSGLDQIFVAYNISEISEMRVAVSSSNVTVEIYSNLGGGFAEPVNFELSDGFAVIRNPSGDMGYIVRDGDTPFYYWVVNYMDHYCHLNSISPVDVQDCDYTNFNVNNEVEAITYYSIDGRPCELSRELMLNYDNLEWDEDQQFFQNVSQSQTLSHVGPVLSINPPLYCASEVTLSGDRFLEKWNLKQSVSTMLSHPNGLAVRTVVEQTNADDSDGENLSNVLRGDVTGLGGSAPADISFIAFTSDAVIHNEWQIATDNNFESILYRFNEKEIDFTFDTEGQYYARFIGSNSDGSCEEYSDVYEIAIGASDLRIPNAFSPNDDGVNDVWKVAYRSLLSFNCWIFDRYGNEIYHFSDPSDGWDGKIRGKKAKSGVYFYVIEAKGADGKNYKKSGDINIIDYRRIGSTASE